MNEECYWIFMFQSLHCYKNVTDKKGMDKWSSWIVIKICSILDVDHDDFLDEKKVEAQIETPV